MAGLEFGEETAAPRRGAARAAGRDMLPDGAASPRGAFLERRRELQSHLLILRQQIFDARDAVATLRDELTSLGRTNADPAMAVLDERYRYMAVIRQELGTAEMQLADLRSRRQDVTRQWRSVRYLVPRQV